MGMKTQISLVFAMLAGTLLAAVHGRSQGEISDESCAECAFNPMGPNCTGCGSRAGSLANYSKYSAYCQW